MLALLALIPTKDKIYAALIALLLVAGAYEYYHLQSVGASKELTLVRAGEAKATAAAKAQADTDTADYNAKLKASQESENAALQTAAAESASLTSKLQYYQAHRYSCPVLPGAASPGEAAVAGSDSIGQAQQGSVVDQDIAALIAAAAHDNAVINAERSERDSLVGK
jgi:hypothetical protein